MNRISFEDVFWQFIGGMLGVLSLALVSWVGDFPYPEERGGTALFIVFVYVLWFIFGARFMARLMKLGNNR
jgi:hypothetical protein